MRARSYSLALSAAILLSGTHADAATVPGLQPLQGTAHAEVSRTSTGFYVLYVLKLTNNSNQAICVPEQVMPFSVAYRGQGLRIEGTNGPPEGVDLGGDPVQSEMDRDRYSVQVVLPHQSIEGVYPLNKYLAFSPGETYRMDHEINFVKCSALDKFSDMVISSGDWTHASHLKLHTEFSVPAN